MLQESFSHCAISLDPTQGGTVLYSAACSPAYPDHFTKVLSFLNDNSGGLGMLFFFTLLLLLIFIIFMIAKPWKDDPSALPPKETGRNYTIKASNLSGDIVVFAHDFEVNDIDGGGQILNFLGPFDEQNNRIRLAAVAVKGDWQVGNREPD